MALVAVDQRLGLRTVVRDHVDTWTSRGGANGKRDRRGAALYYHVPPTVGALIFIEWHVEVHGVGQLLSGVAVLTGLLFGLLVLMFNTGVTLRKDGAAITSAHDLKRLISDIRANVTYTAVVAMALALALVLAAASTPANDGLQWGWAPLLVWLGVHLLLNLFTILRRLRTAFNYITR